MDDEDDLHVVITRVVKRAEGQPRLQEEVVRYFWYEDKDID